jgi:hypothetical protein
MIRTDYYLCSHGLLKPHYYDCFSYNEYLIKFKDILNLNLYIYIFFIL